MDGARDGRAGSESLEPGSIIQAAPADLPKDASNFGLQAAGCITAGKNRRPVRTRQRPQKMDLGPRAAGRYDDVQGCQCSRAGVQGQIFGRPRRHPREQDHTRGNTQQERSSNPVRHVDFAADLHIGGRQCLPQLFQCPREWLIDAVGAGCLLLQRPSPPGEVQVPGHSEPSAIEGGIGPGPESDCPFSGNPGRRCTLWSGYPSLVWGASLWNPYFSIR